MHLAQYETHPLYKRNIDISGKAKISKGNKKTIKALTSEPLSVLTKKGGNIKDVNKQIVINKLLKLQLKRVTQVGS